MAIEQLPDGRWRVDVEPIKGKRFRKTVKTKAEALRFEATCRANCINAPDWSPKPKDKRKLSQVIERWYDLHGHSITSGRRRKNTLLLVAQRLGDPVAQRLTGAHFVELRRRELDDGALPHSINVRFSYLKSVFNELQRLGDLDYPNPLAKVKPLRCQQTQLSYLTREQIPVLLDALSARTRSPQVRLVAEVCLATGCRWSEAESLRPHLVANSSVTFINTKSKRTRTVPISSDLQVRIKAFLDQHGHFPGCLHTFRNALDASGIELPRGQASHVLRHTFASHFMMAGGGVLTLKEILGHASLAMTMRYAHLSPEHLQEALRFNPLDGFDSSSTRKPIKKKKPNKNS